MTRDINNTEDPFASIGNGDVVNDKPLSNLTLPSLSQSAAKQIQKIVLAEPQSGAMFRIKVLGGGCSGFQYKFDLTWQIEKDDMVLTEHDTKFITDQASLPYLDGAELDYVDELSGAYFRVHNPVAKSSCGCGTSFAV